MKKAVVVPLFVLCFCSREAAVPEHATESAAVTTDTAPTTNPDVLPPIPTNIEHFKFWRIQENTGLSASKRVTLTLPGASPWPEDIRLIRFIGNPVQKNGKEVPEGRKALHLVAYELHSAPARTDVRFFNQFTDDQTWKLLPEKPLLLVPAAKKHKKQDLPKVAPPGDHFVCYAVAPPEGQPEDTWFPVGATKPGKVSLVDQFDDNAENIEQLQPAYFCFPVTKEVEGKSPEIPVQGGAKLAIYNIKPPRPYNRTVWTRDQFGVMRLPVTESAMLGVPSELR